MDKVTFTPGEFAAIFGKERTWAYRQLYSGKVQAMTGLGRTLIPRSEVHRLLNEAGRYLGAKTAVRKRAAAEEAMEIQVPHETPSSAWKTAIASRRVSKSDPSTRSKAIFGKDGSLIPLGEKVSKSKTARRFALLRLGGQKLNTDHPSR